MKPNQYPPIFLAALSFFLGLLLLPRSGVSAAALPAKAAKAAKTATPAETAALRARLASARAFFVEQEAQLQVKAEANAARLKDAEALPLEERAQLERDQGDVQADLKFAQTQRARLEAELQKSGGVPAAAPVVPVKPASGPIRTGVLVSKFHATGPSWTGGPYGYGMVELFLTYLTTANGRELDLIPIIEPGTADDPALAEILKASFPGRDPIDATDLKALRTVDILVLPHCTNMYQEVIDAFDNAVAEGTPLLQIGTNGNVTPSYEEQPTGPRFIKEASDATAIKAVPRPADAKSGHREQLARLHGVREISYGFSRQPVTCTVLAEHPLLGALKKGDTLSIYPSGIFGRAIEQVLVQADPEALPAKTGGPEMIFPAVYLAHHGKGAVVGVGWNTTVSVPGEIQQATHQQFYLRALQWLVGRPLDKPETAAKLGGALSAHAVAKMG